MSAIGKLVVTCQGKSISAEYGDRLNELLHNNGVLLRSECGGAGTCRKCLVKIHPLKSVDEPTEEEKHLLGMNRISMGFRLSCMVSVQDNLYVEVVNASSSQDQTMFIKADLKECLKLNTPLQKIFLDLSQIGEKQDTCHLSIEESIANHLMYDSLIINKNALLQFSDLNPNFGLVTLMLKHNAIVSVHPGRHANMLGLAVDLGTTTIGAYLCDLLTGKVVASAGRENPQAMYGEDVISRITALTLKPYLLGHMQKLTASALADMINQLCRQVECDFLDICDICFVGNPTMQAFLLGMSPRSLGQAPYLPFTRRALTVQASDLGLPLKNDVDAYFFPVASGFIGGDAIAAALAQTELDTDESILIVDLGTNGELILINGSQIWATSAATGPAFEGANISCGSRAVPGAAHRVWYDPVMGSLLYDLIPSADSLETVGLCGSGLIDTAAALRQSGALEASGRLNTGSNLVGLSTDRSMPAIFLHPFINVGKEQDLVLTQHDLRQLQLAKAALRVGIDCLMEAAGIERVSRTVLTGAFGASFNWRNAIEIGLLPSPVRLGEVTISPNDAGKGALMALCDYNQRYRCERLAKSIQVVNLNELDNFPMRFIQALSF